MCYNAHMNRPHTVLLSKLSQNLFCFINLNVLFITIKQAQISLFWQHFSIICNVNGLLVHIILNLDQLCTSLNCSFTINSCFKMVSHIYYFLHDMLFVLFDYNFLTNYVTSKYSFGLSKILLPPIKTSAVLHSTCSVYVQIFAWKSV